MLASVLNRHGSPLMPCKPQKSDIDRLSARRITLTAMENFDSANRCSPQGISIPPGPKETGYPGDL